MIHCSSCLLPYPVKEIPYCCPKCGGLFDYTDQFPFRSDSIELNLPGIWRYRHTFGLTPGAPVVYLGEGQTPLVWVKNCGFSFAVKLESSNPTGSHKDRGSALLVSFLKSRGVDLTCEDSSGNAGASLAAYAAKARIKTTIFVPEAVSGSKLTQIKSYGVQVVPVQGPRSKTAQAVKRFSEEQPGVVYASHAYLPFGMAGYATIAYEISEQLGRAPGSIFVPVGHGSLLLGIGRGFQALYQAGEIKHLPILVGVQARACAPLWALFHYGATGLSWVSEGETLAEGIRIRHPLRGDALLQLLESNSGIIEAVEEKEIISGRDQLARMGFYVELTSAVVWPVLEKMAGRVPEPMVLVLTGSGLKSDL